MSVNCSFIGGGCNALYSAIVFCQDSKFNSLVAYPCANQIIVYDVNKVRALLSLSCFEKRVNSVQFFKIGEILGLVAVSGDGKIGLWQLKQDGWVLMDSQKVCSMSVQQVNVLQDDGKNTYFILLGIDGIVRVLDESLNSICILEFGSNVMESVDSVNFRGQLILALSGQDKSVHIYELCRGEKLNLDLSGHSRNVNGLAFQIVGNYVLLASGGKDGYIRIWRMMEADLLQGDLDSENKKGFKSFKLQQSNQYMMKLESVLQGHTEEVSSLRWYSKQLNAKNEQELTLLSSSFDYNIILWVQDIQTGVWCTFSRLGQMQGNKNQFFGLSMSACGNYIIAHTYDGGIYLWNRQTIQDNDGRWREMPAITGHYSQVTDLDVGRGDYMVTCSQDQTSRVWCKWVNNQTWNEIGRPQVHGYDLSAINFLHREDGCMEDIVSGGDEKVLRIFTPSPSTVNYINYLSNQEVRLRGNAEYSMMKKYIGDRGIDVRVYKIGQECISQPLGLMNKQMGGIVDADEFEGESNFMVQIDQVQANEIVEDYNIAPTQSYLSARGLWPEQNKLYGHGYEIVSIATYKNLIASSCRSTSEDAAQIIIWDSKACKILSQLRSHSFSVVQMQFSKNGTYLVSASKDRTISLFQKQDDGVYKLLDRSQQAQRIIYTISIDPSDQEQFVISGSRDKKLRAYLIKNGLNKILEKNMPNPITASELILIAKQKYILILGFDSGDIRLYDFNFDQDKSEFNLSQLSQAAENIKHNMQVNKIKLLNQDNTNQIIHFASCSDDHTVRVFDYNYKL